MKAVLLCLLAASLLAAQDNTISGAEASDGWLLLFDGDSLFGWTEAGPAGWHAASGALAFDGTERVLLRSNTPFADFILKFEFRAAESGNAGSLFLRAPKEGASRDNSYVIRLGNWDGEWPAGSIVGLAKSGYPNPADNQWHAVEIEASGDALSVKLDSRKTAEIKDSRGKAGFLVFEGRAAAAVQIRNLLLKPTGLTPIFNGTDLSGWKAIGPPPPKPPGGGILKPVETILKAGSGKPKVPTWTVQQSGIHGEGGTGQLESQSTYENLLLQVKGRFRRDDKNDEGKKELANAGIFLRGDAGQLFSGYQVRVDGPSQGAIAGFKQPRRTTNHAGDFALETIALNGRHFAIWLDGYLVNEFDDTRPEASNSARGARTAAGPVALTAPRPGVKVDFPLLRVAALPKGLGLQPVQIAAAAPPLPSAPSAPPSAGPVVPVVQPQIAPAVQQVPVQPPVDPNKNAIARLEGQALTSQDPNEQMRLYQQILQMDPNNQVAAQGFRDAKQKVEQAGERQQQQAQEQQQKSQQAANDQASGQQALEKGKKAFIAHDYSTAGAQLAIADRLLPGNREVQKLRSALDRTTQFKQRVKYLVGGCGILVLGGAIVLLFRKRGQKEPYLEIVDGIDKGKRYRLDQEVNHIGAVSQDGGARNEIVVHDVERMISRFHCEIHNKGGKLYLVDCNSSNGTLLNGKRVPASRPVFLRNGSRVSLARTCAVRVGYERRKV